MRILAVDFGSTRIGLALSDPDGILAQPLPFVSGRKPSAAAREIGDICRERQVEEIVLGLPIAMDGSESEMSRLVRQFGERLRRATGLPVQYFDERLTTKLASRILIEADLSRRKRKQSVDSLSAAVILQNYLDANSGNDTKGNQGLLGDDTPES